MSSIVDHRMLPALYEYLRATRPFRGWALPPADEVGFGIIRMANCRGDYDKHRGSRPHFIRLSDRFISFTAGATAVMAHEMVHLALAVNNAPDWAEHGASFSRLAKRVCKLHGFDPKEF